MFRSLANPAILLALSALTFAGCSTESNPVSSIPEPTADFTMSGDRVSPASITFTNRSTEADRYRWEFGGGVTSTQEHPEVIFEDYGTYTITLYATRISTGHTDAYQRQLTITPGRVFLESVVVMQIPYVDAQGAGWDNNGTGPDLQWDLTDYQDDILLSSRTIDNVRPADLPITYSIEPGYELDERNHINLYDNDSPLGYEFMGGFSVSIWTWAEANDYNDTWIVDTNPDLPARNVQVKMIVRWQ